MHFCSVYIGSAPAVVMGSGGRSENGRNRDCGCYGRRLGPSGGCFRMAAEVRKMEIFSCDLSGKLFIIQAITILKKFICVGEVSQL